MQLTTIEVKVAEGKNEKTICLPPENGKCIVICIAKGGDFYSINQLPVKETNKLMLKLASSFKVSGLWRCYHTIEDFLRGEAQ